MARFRDIKTLQKFAAIHASIHNHFNHERHLSQRDILPVMGTLTAISADRLVNDRTGAAHYLARVEIDEGQTENLKGVTLHPGMQADVVIMTGERTALEYLLKPITTNIGRALRES